MNTAAVVAVVAFFSFLCHLSDAALITNLPYAPYVRFKQYAGYLNISGGRHIFYWFAESQNNPSKDPVILWIHGGPGCSGLSALLTENGPFSVLDDGKGLQLNQYSWNKVANFLVIESPVGVGFSYADDGKLKNDDKSATEDNWQALKAFFVEHSEFLANDFFIIGESYGGITVPLLSEKILQNRQDFKINLKGIGIGNGYVSKSLNLNTLVLYAYNHGMVDEKVWTRVSHNCCNGKINECEFSSFSGPGFCALFVQETFQNILYDGLYPFDIYLKCDTVNRSSRYQNLPNTVGHAMLKRQMRPFYATNPLCWTAPRDSNYLNLPEVRAALNVPSTVKQWESCSSLVYDNYDQTISETKDVVRALANEGIQILFYSGDTDMICNFLQGQRFIDSLGFSKTSSKTSYFVNHQVGGFYTDYGKIRFATVRGAGHMSPAEKPDVIFHLVTTFIQKNPCQANDAYIKI